MTNIVPSNLNVSIAGYQASVAFGFPATLDHYRDNAVVAEYFDLEDAWDEYFVAVRRDPSEWAQLVVTQRFSPSGPGFDPGVLIILETETIFIGAGESLLAYTARGDTWSRLWIDAAQWF